MADHELIMVLIIEGQIDGLVQERRNSSALVIELCLPCTAIEMITADKMEQMMCWGCPGT